MWSDAEEPLSAITSGVLSAGISALGAALWDLRLAGSRCSMVLGYRSAADYVASGTHAGAVLGRVCNRLGEGRAWVGDRLLELPRNVPAYHLHGGQTGFSVQRWDVAEHRTDAVTLTLRSPDGHEGYPGNLAVTARYACAGLVLSLDLEATTDAPTLVNLGHHPYFNLSYTETVEDHWLMTTADRVLAVDGNLVPTGAVPSVEGTGFDLRQGRRLRDAGEPAGFLNHTVVLPANGCGLIHAATLTSEITLEVWTTQPALHLYGGHRIPAGIPSREGRPTGPGTGVSIEAQGWTDAPNHPHFPSIVLQPGQPFRRLTEYRIVSPRIASEGPGPWS